MAGTAVSGRLSWQPATVSELISETPHARSIVLDLPDWPGHLAGQHVDMRLTAEDGYQAQRSYSIASAPEDPDLVLTVARVDDGEVSPYLVDDLVPGDELEIRGPIGGYFAWEDRMPGPVLLVGGGSGVVPLRSMLRHHVASHSTVQTRLLYSVRSPEDASTAMSWRACLRTRRPTCASRHPFIAARLGWPDGAYQRRRAQ